MEIKQAIAESLKNYYIVVGDGSGGGGGGDIDETEVKKIIAQYLIDNPQYRNLADVLSIAKDSIQSYIPDVNLPILINGSIVNIADLLPYDGADTASATTLTLWGQNKWQDTPAAERPKVLSADNYLNFTTSAVTNMSNVFYRMNQNADVIDVRHFDTSAVTTLNGFCYRATTALYGLENFNISNVTDLRDLVASVSSSNGVRLAKYNLDLTGWDMRNVQYVNTLQNASGYYSIQNADIFSYCWVPNELDVSGWDFARVTTSYVRARPTADFTWMGGCTSLFSYYGYHLINGGITNCEKITARNMKLPLSINLMFSYSYVDEIDISGSTFYTKGTEAQNVRGTMEQIFFQSKARRINLGIDTKNFAFFTNAFGQCTALQHIDNAVFDFANILRTTSSYSMFANCNKLGQDGSQVLTFKNVPQPVFTDEATLRTKLGIPTACEVDIVNWID